ncbi:hypothetical protein Tco_0510648 [Tanacetum coccineum]
MTSLGQGSNAFKEVAIIKHPSVGEYAIGFITSTLVLRKNSGNVPTNHLYMGDIVLVNSKDVMRPNISVREGIDKKLIAERYVNTKAVDYNKLTRPSFAESWQIQLLTADSIPSAAEGITTSHTWPLRGSLLTK